MTDPGGIPEIDPAHTSLRELAVDNSELNPVSYPVDQHSGCALMEEEAREDDHF